MNVKRSVTVFLKERNTPLLKRIYYWTWWLYLCDMS